MTDTKSCSYCGSETPIRATVCPVCKYHQTRWRNNALFVAGLAGLLTFFVSGLAFTVDRLSLAYKNLVWQDRANVLNFYLAADQWDFVIANRGDGPIFVSDIVISSADTRLSAANRQLLPIAKPLDQNAFLVDQTGKSPPGSFVFNESGALSPEMSKDITGKLDEYGTKFCYLLVYYSESNPGMAMVKQFGSERRRKIVSLHAVGHVG